MALGTLLPAWPALVFAYLEPISLVLGLHAAYSDPISFITKQLPSSFTTPSPPIPASAILLSYTLGSLFLVLFLFSILCTLCARDSHVTKWYLVILACGDIAHLYANYRGMGREVFFGFGQYNEVMVGNVWVTVFLWVNRVATLGGVFGGGQWEAMR
ncbi:hypothetical protein IQ07DRAFT_579950 [Pyrenochaeta sp. DS3sAY3a]|nr:hypothetical protein IQ07DRAFT_579950 [Pyrenochaeta sp. DS3sAY3a]